MAHVDTVRNNVIVEEENKVFNFYCNLWLNAMLWLNFLLSNKNAKVIFHTKKKEIRNYIF